MIKYIKLKYKENSNCLNFGRFEKRGVFKENNIYIGKIDGPTTVTVYDENKNGIRYNIPMTCGFGRMYRLTTDDFNEIEGEFFVKNKKELREVVNKQASSN